MVAVLASGAVKAGDVKGWERWEAVVVMAGAKYG